MISMTFTMKLKFATLYTMVINDVHDYYGEPGMKNLMNRPKIKSVVHKLKIKKL